MATRKLLIAVLAGSSLFIAPGAAAQWLGPTLDAQRADNLRKHQQRQAQQAAGRNGQAQPQEEARPVLTRAERKAAWPIHQAEYERRAASDGYRSADRWFEDQVVAMRGGR